MAQINQVVLSLCSGKCDMSQGIILNFIYTFFLYNKHKFMICYLTKQTSFLMTSIYFRFQRCDNY